MKIKKAIIPCGGLGTRFLPITKSIPKEILPVIDTPVLSYIVDEIVDSGINEILIILGNGKEAIKEYFTQKPSLEKSLKNKPELLELVRGIHKKADIKFALQSEPRGSADAVMCAKDFTGAEPFCMLNGDDLIVADVPVVKQLTDAYAAKKGVILGVQKVPMTETSKYGIVRPTKVDGKTIYCDDMIEKPTVDPPSQYAALGRYVFTAEIYEYIKKTVPQKGELQITDAILAMMKEGKVYAYEFDGRRYDMGDKFGALTATVDFALKNPALGQKFKEYLKSVL